MKVSQFQKLLAAAEQMHRESGDADGARALAEIASLFAGHGTKTVAAFATMLEKAAAADSAQ